MTADYADKITRDDYKRALKIYLELAYPGDEVEFISKWGWLHPKQAEDRFFSPGHVETDDIPNEARFGCSFNPHMKLRVSRCWLPEHWKKLYFSVDTNDAPDPSDMRVLGRELRDAIEAAWREAGLPVIIRNKR